MGKHLHLQISMLFATGTLLFVMFLAWYVYESSYREQLSNVRQATVELMETVAEPATIASYLNQEDMLKDVANGLEKNSIVLSARLTTTQGLEVSAGPQPASDASAYTVQMVLTSPFAGGKVGDLVVTQNKELIEQRAQNTGLTNALTLTIANALVVIFGAIFINSFLTRPITQVATRLHGITPGKDDQLDIPKRHQKNEFGRLINDINYLLSRTKSTIESERNLRQKVEILESKYRRIFEYASSAIFIATPEGEITMTNIAFSKVQMISEKYGRAGNNVCQIFADSSMVKEMLRTAINTRQVVSNDLLFYEKNGGEKWFHAVFIYNETEEQSGEGTIEGILHDITERYMQEKESQRQAERDHLTNLYNRQGVENKLRNHLGRRGGQEDMTLFLMDLDGFKQINDTYGHDSGDMILIEVAKRLQDSCRVTDTIARWGGDEFIVVIYSGYGEEECFAIGHKMLESLTRPIDIGNGKTGVIGASIGVSTLRQNGFDKERLLKSADKAMYEIKEHGKNGTCFYDVENENLSCRMYRPQ